MPSSTMGACPLSIKRSFIRVEIHADNVVAVARETRSGNGADVAHTENANSHRASLMHLAVDPSHRSRRQVCRASRFLRDFAEPVCDQRRFDSAPALRFTQESGVTESTLTSHVRRRLTRPSICLWLKGKSPFVMRRPSGSLANRFAADRIPRRGRWVFGLAARIGRSWAWHRY